MIVQMKKMTLLISLREQESALKHLRKMGVMHIHPIQAPESNEIQDIVSELSQLKKALQILPAVETGKARSKNHSELVKNILEIQQKENTLNSELEDLKTTYGWFERWGNVSNDSIQAIQRAGLTIRFYLTDKGSLKRFPSETQIQIVKEEKGTVYIVFFSDTPDKRLDLKEEPMPKVEVGELKAKIKDFEKEKHALQKSIKKMAVYRDSLIKYQAALEKELEFDNAFYGMGKEDHFVYLQGFCPYDVISQVKTLADKEGWAYLIQEPEEPMDVPTLIRNPKWIRIVDPLFKFMGTLPGYDEYDISFWFLLFFSLFFGILIGDAGYGLVFIGLTLFAHRKAGKTAPKEPFRLMYVLGFATFLWGALSGNWFGYAPIAQISILNRFVIDSIDSFAANNSLFMMYLCFIIGLIHLSIAHGIRAFKIINSPKALGELGWIFILVALFFVAGNLVIGKPMPTVTMWLFVGGSGLVLTFSNFQKKILKGIGTTLGDLPLSIISSFSDVVSYLRLFAVSYASVTVAASFNNMAIGDGIESILHGFMAALVLFLGHALNIILGLMAVIVHGIRLNMLEFSGHLNMQWAGKEYKPFKE
jgi:V/A-type H+-transporting ATPase subunit I